MVTYNDTQVYTHKQFYYVCDDPAQAADSQSGCVCRQPYDLTQGSKLVLRPVKGRHPVLSCQ
jgi:hypothetical protein